MQAVTSPLYYTPSTDLCSSRLVALELADTLLHLLVRVDAETLVLGNAGQLNVLRIKLLLHDLLERAEGESLGLLKSQAPKGMVSIVDGLNRLQRQYVLVVLVDKLGLRAF